MIISYKYKLLPTKTQRKKLLICLEEQRQLYNGALENRISAFRGGKNVTLFDQFRSLTELRKEPEYAVNPVTMQRWTLKRLDDAYQAFFKRVKGTGKAGFPRFRGQQWKTFGFTEFSGIRIDKNRIRIKGLTGIRFHHHRPLEGRPLAATVSLVNGNWHISIQCDIGSTESATGPDIGIDPGLIDLAVTSTGEEFANIRSFRAAERKLRVRQRHLSRCKLGSRGRRKAKAAVSREHARVARRRDTHLHQVTANLTTRYATIYLEKTNIKALARSFVSKSVHDVAWGKFKLYLTYKAERAGGSVVLVNPRFTSQTCSGCGVIEKKPLSQRTHDCSSCGLVLGRDENAALNILREGRSGSSIGQRSGLPHASNQKYQISN